MRTPPWQLWAETLTEMDRIHRAASTHLHRTLWWRREPLWFQMTEHPGAVSIMEQQNYRCWNDSTETPCWVEGTGSRTPKENQALTPNLIWATDPLLLQCFCFCSCYERSRERLLKSSAPLCWCGKVVTFLFLLNVGIEERAGDGESTTAPDALAGTCRPQTN